MEQIRRILEEHFSRLNKRRALMQVLLRERFEPGKLRSKLTGLYREMVGYVEELVRQGVEELGVPLEEHIQFVIEALRPVEDRLGLGTA
jgi:hypothetical protein